MSHNVITDIQDRVTQMPKAAQLFYDQLIEEGKINIFSATTNLREGLNNGTVPVEFRSAANLALVAMQSTLTDEKTRTSDLNDSDAIADVRQRLDAAQEVGDVIAANALQGGLDRNAERKQAASAQLEQMDAFHKKQTAEAEQEQKERYEQMLRETKAAEMQRIIAGNLDMQMHPEQAEQFYERHHAAAIIQSVQQATGYVPAIEAE